MPRFIFAVLALVATLFVQTSTASARVNVQINLSTQRMQVTSSSGTYNWAVSTARAGYVTPRGVYAPTSLQTMHYSRKYHMSPMPHSIFFRGGYAIHGTGAVGALGRPASHGCIRLAPGNAAKLFQMVKAEGATISITGSAPGKYLYAKKKMKHQTHFAAKRTKSNPMAYAPARSGPDGGSMKSWQRNPMRY